MTAPGLCKKPFRAILRREAITTRHNRFVQIFAFIVLAGSSTIATLSGHPEAVPYALLLLFLYIVPLFGLLVGVSAAQEEREEWSFLRSQPVARHTFILGKASVLSTALGGVLALALIPALAVGTPPSSSILLGFLGIALALVSVSSGLTIGYYANTQARGLMMALLAWFTAFGLYDVLALGLSDLQPIQEMPFLWVALLLLNPIDAVRLTGLFGLEQVPLSVAGLVGWIEPLISWLPLWVGVLAVAWTSSMLVLACRRFK
jgi:hypothetical protein